MGSSRMNITDPLAMIAAKRKVEPELADQLSLAVLIALDAAKRGAAPAAMSNTLTEHLLTSVAIWSQQENNSLYAAGARGWIALVKACARPTQFLDLTTGEYKDIRTAISYYVRALPKLEIGALIAAQQRALKRLAGEA